MPRVLNLILFSCVVYAANDLSEYVSSSFGTLTARGIYSVAPELQRRSTLF